MTNNSLSAQAGISTVEFLVAIMLFSIIVIALVQFQENLQRLWLQQNSLLDAERLAFKQLEIYPDQLPYDATRWHYQHQITAYSADCDLIQVTFIHIQGYQSRQQRLICHQSNRVIDDENHSN
ncbi:prepilin-type N-terminal cleavage/methylation domain-containing protein [Utexia brackfieldae]|uniref:prepilin-type N-terminal cleavage/methylation domain-containing protein n=1 Tax=Utexia brackfieldae TaxID=3074108 RepID=UPI00370D3241